MCLNEETSTCTEYSGFRGGGTGLSRSNNLVVRKELWGGVGGAGNARLYAIYPLTDLLTYTAISDHGQLFIHVFFEV